MPAIPNISFSVRFDLTGSPKIILTDTSTHGLSRIAAFSVLQPDGYERNGSLASPDLQVGQTVFEMPLALDGRGNPQQGVYEIVMTSRASGYDDTEFEREISVAWAVPVPKVEKELDVITPRIELIDNTSYSMSGYTHTFVSRTWSVSSTPTGVISGSGGSILVQKDGSYYSAAYTYQYACSFVYASVASPWFTIADSFGDSSAFSVFAIPSYFDVVKLISDLRQGESCSSSCKSRWSEANNLLDLILHRIGSGYMGDVDDDVQDLLQIIGGAQTITNNVINQFFSFGAGGGTSAVGFATNIGNGVASIYNVSHLLGSTDIVVNVWDNVLNDLVICDVVRQGSNSVTLTFDDPVPLNRYRVVIVRA